MASKDIDFRNARAQSLAPASRTADANGTVVDLAGYEGAVIVFDVGAEGITLSGTDKIALKVEHGDLANGSDMVAVPVGDLIGEESAGVVKTLDDVAEAPAIYAVSYIGAKRYVRAVADYSGTHGAGTVIAAHVVKGAPRHA